MKAKSGKGSFRVRRQVVPMVVAAVITAACSTDRAPTPEDMRAIVEKTMGAFAAMDLQTLQAGLSSDVVAFEFDLEGKPVRLGSHDDVVRFAEDIFGQMKKMGAKMALDFHSTSCRTGQAIAYCTVEFDFKATMADGTVMVQPTRNTIILQQRDNEWKWTHWHSSPAAAQAGATRQ